MKPTGEDLLPRLSWGQKYPRGLLPRALGAPPEELIVTNRVFRASRALEETRKWPSQFCFATVCPYNLLPVHPIELPISCFAYDKKNRFDCCFQVWGYNHGLITRESHSVLQKAAGTSKLLDIIKIQPQSRNTPSQILNSLRLPKKRQHSQRHLRCQTKHSTSQILSPQHSRFS